MGSQQTAQNNKKTGLTEHESVGDTVKNDQ